MSQTSYPTTKLTGYAGNQYDSAQNADIVSRVLEAASGVNPGTGLVAGTSKELQAKPPTVGATITTDFIGICMRQNLEQPASGAVIPDKQLVSIGRKGRFFVQVEGAVAAMGTVFCRHASGGGGTVVGLFRADADTATATLVPNARYITATSGAGVAVVELS